MAKNIYKWDRDIYNVEVLSSMNFNENQLREEYRRLRKIAQNRMSRLKKEGFNIEGMQEFFSEHLDKNAQIADKVDLPYLLNDVVVFLDRKTTTVEGRRQYIDKSIEKLHDNGYYFINRSNFEEFGRFMEEMRLENNSKYYSSERIAMLYESMTRLNIPRQNIKENFQEYLKKAVELDHFDPTPAEEKKYGSIMTLEKIEKIKKDRALKKKLER